MAQKEEYKDFFGVYTRISQIIRTQKFEGAAVGLFNANIIARDLGLADKQSSELHWQGRRTNPNRNRIQYHAESKQVDWIVCILGKTKLSPELFRSKELGNVSEKMDPEHLREDLKCETINSFSATATQFFHKDQKEKSSLMLSALLTSTSQRCARAFNSSLKSADESQKVAIFFEEGVNAATARGASAPCFSLVKCTSFSTSSFISCRLS